MHARHLRERLSEIDATAHRWRVTQYGYAARRDNEIGEGDYHRWRDEMLDGAIHGMTVASEQPDASQKADAKSAADPARS